jgi:hypothetical protein
MSQEEMMDIFEKECGNWGFDFDKGSDDTSKSIFYSDYETGVMFGMFTIGFDAATKHFGVE